MFVLEFLIDRWTSYANIKSMKENAGQKGRLCPDYHCFTCDELKKHLGVIKLNGLPPFPRISMEFKSQKDDFANGNDFIKSRLGPNAEHCHKYFKRFFLRATSY